MDVSESQIAPLLLSADAQCVYTSAHCLLLLSSLPQMPRSISQRFLSLSLFHTHTYTHIHAHTFSLSLFPSYLHALTLLLTLIHLHPHPHPHPHTVAAGPSLPQMVLSLNPSPLPPYQEGGHTRQRLPTASPLSPPLPTFHLLHFRLRVRCECVRKHAHRVSLSLFCVSDGSVYAAFPLCE